MNIESINKTDCCGCSGCMAVCPEQAIAMKADTEGFIYFSVDKTKCIDCGLCINVCNRAESNKKDIIKAYAIKNRNELVLNKSSSGGVSHGLLETIITAGGVVYGVVYDDDYKVITRRADSLNDCDAFYESKYVQTNPLNTFSEVKDDLTVGKKVLYFGTSCHISGLLSFLSQSKVDTDNLYTVDLICHGVPSPLLFADYIDWLKQDLNFVSFHFRTKHKPWGYGSKNFGCTIDVSSKLLKRNIALIDTPKARAFLNLFFSNNCLRPHCHSCRFAGINKPADLTIADYWGCAEEEPDFFSERGVSAVLVHTEKGDMLLKQSRELLMKLTTVDQIQKKQGNMSHPSPISEDRDDFWQLYYNHGFDAVVKKYGSFTFKQRIKYLANYLKII